MSTFDLQGIVKDAIESAVKTYLNNKREPDSQHVLLDRLFPAERRIRSIIGGLETSLGTMLWERIAREIAQAKGFSKLDAKAFPMPQPIPPELSAIIGTWQVKREAAGANLSLNSYVLELRELVPNISHNNINYTRLTKGKGVDLWLERDGVEYAFDIKTVQINAGSGLKFNSTLLDWYAYRIFMDPDVDIEARIIIPYSPFKPFTIDSWWANMGGRAYPLRPSEDVWVQDQFWDFLTGETNTWQQIVGVFDQLGSEGFGDQFRGLFYPS